jgi:DNA replication protein DnaC
MQAPVSRPGQRRAEEPRGRRAECAALDQLAEDIRAGESRTLVIYGEPGIGKTAPLIQATLEEAAARGREPR